ncbi:MAG TPA: phosphotransferase [Ktedonobacterales bacterium]
MTSSESSGDPLLCPICGIEMSRIAVTGAGEVIGCEPCAEQRGVEADILTEEEWTAPDSVRQALAEYGIIEYQATKSPCTETREPRAHVWEVTAGDKRYVVKRFHAWLEDAAIEHERSVLSRLAERRMPVAAPMLSREGAPVVRVVGERWALYPTLGGRHLTQQEWMWHIPRAAETLAEMHVALEDWTPDGAPHSAWDSWNQEKLEAMLAQWPALDDIPLDLLDAVRDRLAERYFSGVYEALPRTIVHGDFCASNVLWHGEQVVGILDFEKAHRDTVLFDFGWGIGTRHPPLVRAVVATYTRTRPLSPLEREALPEALLIGTLMAIHSQLTVFKNVDAAVRRAQDLFFLMRDAEILRRAVAVRPA